MKGGFVLGKEKTGLKNGVWVRGGEDETGNFFF